MNEYDPVIDELQRLALEILRQDVGVWDARWEFLDGSGNIGGSATGTQTMEFIIEDAVMLITMDVPEIGQKSVTHRFYKPDEERIYWISVDNKGDQWTFVEDFPEKTAMSLPHKNADGSVTHLRFKSLRETGDEVDVLMEMSSDRENWIPLFRQYRVRK